MSRRRTALPCWPPLPGISGSIWHHLRGAVLVADKPGRPRLLFVSPRFLFPMDQGGKIRTGNILRGMKGRGFEVTLVSPAPADSGRYAAEVASACDRFVSWPEAARSRVRR